MAKKAVLWFAVFAVVIGVRAQAFAAIGNEIIYQIVTDRFHDGNPSNNCGDNDLKLSARDRLLDRMTCDPTRQDWNKYWGGDFEGIIAKLDYLKTMGVTKIWISPVIENARGFASGDGVMKTSFHGFWGRDWFRLNEHFTKNGTKDFESFDRLVTAAKEKGIGVVLDTVANHTSPAYDAEYGALYNDGELLTDYLTDQLGWFHKYPAIRWDLVENEKRVGFLREYMFQNEMRFGRAKPSDWERYSGMPFSTLKYRMLELYKLADLADLDTELPSVRAFLRRAHAFWQSRGIAGFRVDTVRHVSQDFLKEFVRGLQVRQNDFFIVGEWYGGGPGDADSMAFVKNTGMTIFDFKLREELKELVLGSKNPRRLVSFLESSIDKTTGDDAALDLVTFIDNHDMPRMQVEGAADADVLELMKLLYGIRGVPCIYYGLEVFSHVTTEGGKDPYNREMMNFPTDPSKAPGVKMLKALAELREAHPALRFGKTRVVRVTDTAFFIAREYKDETVYLALRSRNPGASNLLPVPKGYAERSFDDIRVGGKQSRWRVSFYLKSAEKTD